MKGRQIVGRMLCQPYWAHTLQRQLSLGEANKNHYNMAWQSLHEGRAEPYSNALLSKTAIRTSVNEHRHQLQHQLQLLLHCYTVALSAAKTHIKAKTVIDEAALALIERKTEKEKERDI